METNKNKLLSRQLKDIINLADSLKFSRSFFDDFNNFSKYSEEMKQYILKNVDVNEIKEEVAKIPKLDIKLYQRMYWYHYLILPWYFVKIYNEMSVKNDLLPEIESTRNKYIRIYEILNSLAGSELS